MSLFSDRLRELRGTESQASFASAIGVNRVQYLKYESGKNAPSIDFLEKLCRVHACSADWLLGIDKAPSMYVHGSGNAIAIGSHAKASSRTTVVDPGKMSACKACPCKTLYDAVQKAQTKIK